MRVLVTGGNRYIGLDLVHQLVKAGHDVTVVNSHATRLPDAVSRIEADRTQPGALTRALQPYVGQFDAVFDHTAYDVADMEPLLALFADSVQHYVFTSSQAVYRRSFVQPIHEDFRRHDPADTDHRKAYGVGKVRCEDQLLGLAQSAGLPATVLRVGHTMGPRSPQPTRDPWFFARIEQGRPILIPGDGFSALQLIHINDVARLMVSLLGVEAVKGQAYNVGGAEVASLLAVVQLIGRAMSKPVDVVHVPPELAAQHPPLVHWGEAKVGPAFMSIDKALRDIPWQPAYGIESGYRDAWQWYDREGRDQFSYDFSAEDEILGILNR